MRILFIDVASNQGTLACVTDSATVALTTIDHRISDGELLPVFDAVLRKAGWTEKDLTHIACVTGPGGFTSLRVGVSFANAIAHALNIPSAGIHLSDLYGARVANGQLKVAIEKGTANGNFSLATGNFVWVHSTKVTAMFVRGFGSFAKTWPEPTLVSVEDFLSSGAETPASPLRWCGEAIETHRALLEEKNVKPAPLKKFEEVLPGFLQNLPYAKAPMQPWYGREG